MHSKHPSVSRADALRQLRTAESVSEAVSLFFYLFPPWVPPCAVIGGCCVYYLSIVTRIKLARWRIAERRRAKRQYALLEGLQAMHKIDNEALESRGGCGSLAPIFSEADIDEEEEEEEDLTAVSLRDLDEFRSSLGIVLPRDEDLLVRVERLLVDDPIPDGWALYRTTAGIIRFMNRNTQELSFAHPAAEEEKNYIESEVRRRDRELTGAKFGARTRVAAMDTVMDGGHSSGYLEMGSSSDSHLTGGFLIGSRSPWIAEYSSGRNGGGIVGADGNGDEIRGSGSTAEYTKGGRSPGSGRESVTSLGGAPEGSNSMAKGEGSKTRGETPNSLGTSTRSHTPNQGNILSSLPVKVSSTPALEHLPSPSGNGAGSESVGGGAFSGEETKNGFLKGTVQNVGRRALNYFLAREQKKIKKDVEEESKKAAEATKVVSLFSSDGDDDTKGKNLHRQSGGRVLLPSGGSHSTSLSYIR